MAIRGHQIVSSIFLSVSADKSVNASALVMASANALHLPDPGSQGYEQMKGHVNMLTSLVKKTDRPTIMLEIGIIFGS